MEITQLHITPIIREAKYLVLVNETRPVLLPLGRFELLVKALTCRVTKPQGCFIAQDLGLDRISFYQVISRMRNDFANVLGKEVRQKLISSLGQGRYRIDLDRKQVTIDSGLEDLVPNDLASKDVEMLRKHYPVRSRNVDAASAPDFYDSIPSTRAKTTRSKLQVVQENEKTVGHLMDTGFVVNRACVGDCQFWHDVQSCANKRYAIPVEVEVARLDAGGVAIVVVSNGDHLFTHSFTFRYCAPKEFRYHALEFAKTQRGFPSGDNNGQG